MYENTDICAKCGGLCCKSLPGTCHPVDFGLPEEDGKKALRSALASGKYAIDSWEGDPTGGNRKRVLFIRPATKGNEGRLRDDSWGGECTFLGINGCTLEADKRPLNCKLIEPSEQECKYHGVIDHPKKHGAVEWIPFQKLLRGMAE